MGAVHGRRKVLRVPGGIAFLFFSKFWFSNWSAVSGRAGSTTPAPQEEAYAFAVLGSPEGCHGVRNRFHPRIPMRWMVHLGVLLLCGCATVQPAAAGQAGLRPKTKGFSVKSRIVARVPLEALTSVGLNHETYLFEIESGMKDHAPQLVKVSYRFHLREPELPTSFLDYALVHRFNVRRDDSCDESWGAVSTRYLFDRNGNFRGSQNALVYTSNAPVPQMDKQAVLSCYVVTPQDYHSTEKKPSAKQPVAKNASAK